MLDDIGLHGVRLVSPGPVGEKTWASLVADNLVAFALRGLSARAATQTIDLQYYAWAEDVTGQLLIREILLAADRGVRVRLLLDDLYPRRAERVLATLASHPHIQIRFFNPFRFRAWGLLGDAVEFLCAGYRLNHRMHNKAWIVDRLLLIGGGRNVGDQYFDASSQFNFRDLDLVLVGKQVSQALKLFETYWTSSRVRSIDQIAAVRPFEGGLGTLRQSLNQAAVSNSAPAYLRRLDNLPGLPALLEQRRVSLDMNQLSIVADPPGKGDRARRTPFVLDTVWNTLRVARKRVLIISPYFVPGRRGSRLLIGLARRGVQVSVLTNSLAATDVLAVHGGYARYRRRLLRAGITLHELRRGGQQGQSLFGSGHASLHTKAFAVDDELAFVGSFNIDPRSAYLNTEMGVFVLHPALAGELGKEFTRLTDPSRSWTVTMQDRRPAWTDQIGDQTNIWHREPEASLTRRVVARVLGWLPIEHQL